MRIWNKPKFVLSSHYVITLDRIAGQPGGIEVLQRLLAHPGIAAQVKEWRELGMVAEDFMPEQIWETDLTRQRLDARYQYLPLDTKHFPDLELSIIALFDHLDHQLDGWLVHSENYQALVTMHRKWNAKVQCIYIDPPYNTHASEIEYANGYKHSSWLSMMENRLVQAKKLLACDGVMCVAIDHVELHRLRMLLDNLFGEANIIIPRADLP